MNRALHIMFVVSEAVPFAKTGGLADVAGSLPLALSRAGMHLSVVMPLYGVIKQGNFTLTKELTDLEVAFDFFKLTFDVYRADVEGVSFYFIERDEFFERRQLYGTPKGDYFDNLERYTFLAKTLLPVCQALNLNPDIIHCHDWQSALVPVYLREKWREAECFAQTASVFTIHNLAYQGLFRKEKYHLLDLDPSLFSIDGLEFYDQINFLKAGILWADAITTVSRQYSREIQTPEFGCGLEGVLQSRAASLTGIVNGVDYRTWNPASDKLIAAPFSPGNLAGKTKNKKALMEAFLLDAKLLEAPLFGMVSRLADQKGLDLLSAILPELMAAKATLVILGTGEEKYHQLLTEAAQKYRGQLGIKIAFDNQLAHLIEAGADMFLMPSHYEPCGLNQIYSLKYGTIPVVRATGGLVDTIEPVDAQKKTGTGFRFTGKTPEAFWACMQEAMQAYQNKTLWKQLMSNAMNQDFSWEASATMYESLYRQTLAPIQF
ncbi:glycogen synthase GlgA [Desulfobacca acetoxidans]|uniref:Glycogen synthase n=1 Tax=Desulfobacca acetoxidans (strain ATCC 700848 / DSM 11109 / ASRB2) TaxID=880072 RepID=F2NCA7_DESAR|nr:glycogen synthase GlgA [Desulfobacca acetoxidans]AEB08971.1 Glycogen synthase [Desulfobacca acetoxidans DSM 11109]